MKRELMCDGCVDAIRAIPKYPDEGIKIVQGLMRGACFCDGCNDALEFGDQAYAVSIYAVGAAYFEWEGEHLTAMGTLRDDGDP